MHVQKHTTLIIYNDTGVMTTIPQKNFVNLKAPVYAIGARGKVVHKVNQNGDTQENIPRQDINILKNALQTNGGKR